MKTCLNIAFLDLHQKQQGEEKKEKSQTGRNVRGENERERR